ncbi:MAG: TRAP transporter large permease [Deinococcales bacterium]
MIWVPFVALVGLIVLSVPVGFAMGLTSLLVLWINHAFYLLPALSERMYSGTTSFLLLAIPFFILAGFLMNAAGMTTRLFRFANYMVGGLPGGLGHVDVLASMIFSGMSGSAVADASALGAIEIKAMTDAGYDKDFAAAITAAASTIGPVIPPSIPFVIYGGLANVSIGALFLAGFLPGLVMGLALMVAVYLIARRRNYPRLTERPSFRTLALSFLDALAAIGTVVIIVGGIVGGFFTPTEAAAVASLYALLLGLVVYRSLNIRDIPKILWDTTRSSVQVLFIIAAAAVFACPRDVHGGHQHHADRHSASASIDPSARNRSRPLRGHLHAGHHDWADHATDGTVSIRGHDRFRDTLACACAGDLALRRRTDRGTGDRHRLAWHGACGTARADALRRLSRWARANTAAPDPHQACTPR